jgi:hypothetical protein
MRGERTWIVLVGVLACVGTAGCTGGLSELDETREVPDASCSVDAADAAVVDVAPAPDVVLLDHGTNGFAVDAALPHCQSQQDCEGWATCQEGLCCAGALVDGGVCLCGATAGCDLRHTCCVPFASTTGVPECVADCVTQCGCTQAPQ